MFNQPKWAARIDLDVARGMVAAVSTPRLAPYGLGTIDDPVRAVVAHGRNITLCEAAYPVLHVLEVVMRNRIHDAFRSHFRVDDWYARHWLLPPHRTLVEKAQSDLLKQKKLIDPDRTVAALSFGFWCGMFNAHYESGNGLWPALLSTVLPRVPKSWRTRAKIKSRVEEARYLRNRVFHHERIAHLPDLPARHRRMIELLGWFSPEARSHVESLCRFRTAYDEHPRVEALPEGASHS